MSLNLKRYKPTDSAWIVRGVPTNVDEPAAEKPSKPKRVNDRLIQFHLTQEVFSSTNRTAPRARQSTYNSSQPPVSKDPDKLQRRTLSSTLPVRHKWENENIICLSDGEDCEPVSSAQKVVVDKRTPSEGYDARARRTTGTGWNLGFATSKPIAPPKHMLEFSTAPAVQSIRSKANGRSTRYQGQQGPQLAYEKVVGYWIPYEEEALPSAPKPEDKGMIVPGDNEYPDYGGFEIGPEHEDVVYCGPAFWRRTEEDEVKYKNWAAFQNG
jgi:hypothetical protein